MKCNCGRDYEKSQGNILNKNEERTYFECNYCKTALIVCDKCDNLMVCDSKNGAKHSNKGLYFTYHFKCDCSNEEILITY
jgi:hypothetical protein